MEQFDFYGHMLIISCDFILSTFFGNKSILG